MTGIQRSYLGDGLYAEFDGYQFRLYTARDGGVHEVFLDHSVLEALMRFVAEMREEKAP